MLDVRKQDSYLSEQLRFKWGKRVTDTKSEIFEFPGGFASNNQYKNLQVEGPHATPP